MEDKCSRLQQLVGSEPQVRVESFSNWAGTQHRKAVLAVRPETLEQVQAVVRGCRSLGLRVRAAGAGHTYNNLVAADEGQVMLYTAAIKRHDGPQMELIKHPDGQQEIHAMAGQTCQQLHDFQLAHDVAIPCNAAVLEVTIGGLIAPFTNGTGREGLSIHERISWMRIVDSGGNLRTYSTDKDGKDIMRAIQLNLGLFGIIYDVRLQVEPSETVRTDEEWVLASTVQTREYLQELYDSNDHATLIWIPFEGIKVNQDGNADVRSWSYKQDRINVRRINRPSNPKYNATNDAPPCKPDFAPSAPDMGEVLQRPELTPLRMKQDAETMKSHGPQGPVYEKYPKAMHYIPAWAPMTSNSWAIDAGRQYEHAQAALTEVMSLVETEAHAGRFPLNLMVVVRLIKANDIYLSSAQAGLKGSGHTLMIEAATNPQMPGARGFYTEISTRWQHLPGAVPHWAKHWHQLPGVIELIRERYSDQIRKFLSQLDKSGADPDGIFLNTELEKIFYPESHPGYAKLERMAKLYTSQNEHCTKTSN